MGMNRNTSSRYICKELIHLPAADTSSSSRYIFQQQRISERGKTGGQEPVPMVHEVQASLGLLRLTLRNHVSPTQVEMEVVG